MALIAAHLNAKVILKVTVYRYIYIYKISLFSQLHTPFPAFSPSLISFLVSVDVMLHVYYPPFGISVIVNTSPETARRYTSLTTKCRCGKWGNMTSCDWPITQTAGFPSETVRVVGVVRMQNRILPHLPLIVQELCELSLIHI